MIISEVGERNRHFLFFQPHQDVVGTLFIIYTDVDALSVRTSCVVPGLEGLFMTPTGISHYF
jgi:hypothetical protein